MPPKPAPTPAPAPAPVPRRGSHSRQRRDDEKEQRREALIDAAEVVFAAAGFESAKMEDVARQARVSRALVYLYFGSRDELLLAICSRALQMLRERFIAAAAAHRTGIEQIAAIGRAYVDFADAQPLHFSALSRFEAKHPDAAGPAAAERAVLEIGQSVHEVTVGALRSGMRDGSIRRLPQPMLAAMTLWGFIHGTIQIAQTKRPILAEAGVDREAFLQHSIEQGLRGLRPDAPKVATKSASKPATKAARRRA